MSQAPANIVLGVLGLRSCRFALASKAAGRGIPCVACLLFVSAFREGGEGSLAGGSGRIVAVRLGHDTRQAASLGVTLRFLSDITLREGLILDRLNAGLDFLSVAFGSSGAPVSGDTGRAVVVATLRAGAVGAGGDFGRVCSALGFVTVIAVATASGASSQALTSRSDTGRTHRDVSGANTASHGFVNAFRADTDLRALGHLAFRARWELRQDAGREAAGSATVVAPFRFDAGFAQGDFIGGFGAANDTAGAATCHGGLDTGFARYVDSRADNKPASRATCWRFIWSLGRAGSQGQVLLFAADGRLASWAVGRGVTFRLLVADTLGHSHQFFFCAERSQA